MTCAPARLGHLAVIGLIACLFSTPGCVSDSGVDVFPLYRNLDEADGSSETSVLWPLSNFESNETGSSSWIAPFYYSSDGDAGEGLIVPLIPPIWLSNDNSLGSSRQIFPLYYTKTEGAKTESNILFFLSEWSSYEGEDGLATLNVLPLFQWGDDAGRDRLAFGHVGGPGPGALVSLYENETYGRAYYGDGDKPGSRIDIGSLLFHFVELFHYDDLGSHTDVRFLNITGNEVVSLFQHVSPHEGAPGADYGRTILFPFWWDMTEGDRRTKHLWPLYGATTRAEETLVHWILFPLLRLEDDPVSEVSRTDFIWPLIGHKSDPVKTRSWFFPLFQYTSTEQGYSWDVILGSFGYGATEEKSQLTLLWIPISL